MTDKDIKPIKLVIICNIRFRRTGYYFERLDTKMLLPEE